MASTTHLTTTAHIQGRDALKRFAASCGLSSDALGRLVVEEGARLHALGCYASTACPYTGSTTVQLTSAGLVTYCRARRSGSSISMSRGARKALYNFLSGVDVTSAQDAHLMACWLDDSRSLPYFYHNGERREFAA